jgi:hypothetical protein
MATGYKKIQDKERRKIVADYINGDTMNYLAKKYKRSTSTIKRIIDKGKSGEFGDFEKKVETVKKRNTADILATLLDDDTVKIITKYKAVLIKDENIAGALDGTMKIQPFINAIGMFLDKALAYSKIQDDKSNLTEASTNLMDILKIALERKDV